MKGEKPFASAIFSYEFSEHMTSHCVFYLEKDGEWLIYDEYPIWVSQASINEDGTLRYNGTDINIDTFLNILAQKRHCNYENIYVSVSKKESEMLLYTDNKGEFDSWMEQHNISKCEPFCSSPEDVIIFKEGKLVNITSEEAKIVAFAKKAEKITDISVNEANYLSVNGCEAGYLNRNTRPLLGTKEFFDWRDKNFYPDCNHAIMYVKRTVLDNFYYLTNDNVSVKIIKASIQYELKDDGCWYYSVTKESEFYYNIDRKKSYCVKYYKRGKMQPKDISPTEFFNINSFNICYGNPNFVIDGYRCINEWFVGNEVFCRKIGFYLYTSRRRGRENILASIILYLSVIYLYPSVELLIKSGHVGLITEFFDELYQSNGKLSLQNNISKLDHLVDGDSYEGSTALRFPSYIGNYLKAQNAEMNLYTFWRDVYEIEHISKENFERIVDMPEMLIFISCIGVENLNYVGIQDIIKHEHHTLEKTVKYVLKYYNDGMSKNEFYIVLRNFVTMYRDTLEMADVLGIEVEPYPSDMITIHNELLQIQNSIAESNNNKICVRTAETCTEVIEKAVSSNAANIPKKLIEKYTYVFPKTQAEFTQEGISQHNCVSGYSRHVTNGTSIIFFVRKKESPDESYITAQINQNGLGQVMYSNNRAVHKSSEDYSYCAFICNKVLDAYERDEICGFKKIAKFINWKEETV